MNEHNHSERSHHAYGPSRLPYLEQCPGFQSAESSEAGQKAADEGTASHEVMDRVAERVKSCLPERNTFSTCLPFVIIDEDRLIEDNERALLEFCAVEVDKFLNAAPQAIENEVRVFINRHDGSELNHGLIDLLLIFGESAVLLDYKFGFRAVPAAKDNPQGLNYALGVLNRHQRVKRLGVVFIQPKLNRVSTHLLKREDYTAVHARVERIIDRAIEASKLDPESEAFSQVAKPGNYCAYCSLKGRCGAQMRQMALTVQEYSQAPITLDWARLETPENMAKARYMVDVLENMISEVKKRSMEFAETNGGRIEGTLPDGTTVAYEVATRAVPRVVGEAGLVADLLGKEYGVTSDEVLAAADLSLGALTPIGVKVIQERVNGAADKELAEADAYWATQVESGAVKASEAKKQLAEAKREIKARKVTVKEAEAQFHATLEAEGLLSRPDTKIKYLKCKTTTKQLTN